MRWGDFRKSENVEDRGAGGGMPVGGFGGSGVKLGGGAMVLLVIVGLLFGVNPLDLIEGGGGGPSPPMQTQPKSAPPGYGPQQSPPAAAAKDPAKEFAARVLGDTEDVWGAVFKTMGARYDPPKLVLFRGTVRSACGNASAAVGPFYCSADRDVYLDTAFFEILSQRFRAPGDFAAAYVIAHEVGHHVQNITGVMRQFDEQSRRADARTRNALSVRLELQADCYAGVWGHFAQRRNLLEAGDLEEGLRAASAVGDDMIQKQAQGYVAPDSFTHGSAQQRRHWFKVGFDTGDLRNCNTFANRSP
jgi:predicted metalloprotease